MLFRLTAPTIIQGNDYYWPSESGIAVNEPTNLNDYVEASETRTAHMEAAGATCSADANKLRTSSPPTHAAIIEGDKQRPLSLPEQTLSPLPKLIRLVGMKNRILYRTVMLTSSPYK